MIGKIVKGIAGFYYVFSSNKIYECKAKGVFRNRKIKPLVGDDVELEVIDEDNCKGNVVDILPRRNELIRPAVANVDQALVFFAVKSPDPNLNLLDRFLIQMEQQNLESIICFNKTDLASRKEVDELVEVYTQSGYRTMDICAGKGQGIDEIYEALRGKVTTIAGPSGAGKSTVINALSPELSLQTGELSDKLGRGKHTTRHSEILPIGEDTYIIDTPGFTSMDVFHIGKEELGRYYREFEQYEPNCRFASCSHITEPDCGVRQALEDGLIHTVRYDNYVKIYRELKDRRRNG